MLVILMYAFIITNDRTSFVYAVVKCVAICNIFVYFIHSAYQARLTGSVKPEKNGMKTHNNLFSS